jgi:tetratricopeptide (TPR) repeat protein
MKGPLPLRILSLVAGFALAAGYAAAAGKPAAPTVKPATPREVPITSKSAEAVEFFKKGREYAEDIRTVEAIEQFKKALELDADFALARAWLGAMTPGKEGLDHLERAAVLARGLSDSERVTVEIMLADERGEEAKVRTLRRKLVSLAPGDWRVHLGLGEQLSSERKWPEAITTLKKAAGLNPRAGSAYNLLGYDYLTMGKSDSAVEAFRKYVSLRPEEPNPQDSLAEALMAAGRFDEAETAFRKALSISPRFWVSWEGIAHARFLRGDWSGGREALAKARDAATRPIDKLEIDARLAWSQAAEGDTAAALATFDAIEKSAAGQNLDVTQAFTPIDRAILLCDTGKPEEALNQVALALENAGKVGIPGGALNDLRRQALAVRIEAEARLGRAADAAKTLAQVEDEVKKTPTNAGLQSIAHFARGSEAMSRGDATAAVDHFSQCIAEDYECRLHLMVAQKKAGDKAGAEATRLSLQLANRRDPLYLFIRSELAEPAAPQE